MQWAHEGLSPVPISRSRAFGLNDPVLFYIFDIWGWSTHQPVTTIQYITRASECSYRVLSTRCPQFVSIMLLI